MAGVQIDGVNNKIDFDDDLDTSISANTDDTLVIEAGGNTMATITATTFTINDGTTITTADNTDTLSLISTDADATSGPNLRLFRNSSSPADSDDIGKITFSAENSASEEIDYATIRGDLLDVTDGTEDGVIKVAGLIGGQVKEFARFGDGVGVVLNEESNGDQDFRVESNGNTHMLFVDGGNNRVGVGTAPDLGDGLHIRKADSGASVSADADDLVIEEGTSGQGAGMTILNATNGFGFINFGDSGDNDIGKISYDHPNNALRFNTNASERMRITSAGTVGIGTSSPGGFLHINHDASSSPLLRLQESTSTSARSAINFRNPNGLIGSIVLSGSATAYNTSSDHRLKENVSYDFDATTRLKQLKPSRFNFIADADTTVDGFLAHEVSSIVPEAVTGSKDATETQENVVVDANGQVIVKGISEDDWTAGKVADKDGNTQYPSDSTWEASKVVPVYQAIDQSKLVPLLVKTIQELEARVTTLEG